MGILYTILANALALFAVTKVLDSFHIEGGVLTFVIVAVVLSILNLIMKPILKLLTFPLIFLTGGLFLVVINALILYLTQYFIKVLDISGASMQVDKPLTYLWAALILGLANWLIHWFLKDE